MGGYNILAVSDGSGKTARAVIQSALVQFEVERVAVRVIPRVDTEAKVRRVVHEAAQGKTVIVFTLVSPALRDLLFYEARNHNVQVVDLLGPILARFEGCFNLRPKSIPGIHKSGFPEYEARIEALDFMVAHDDGLGLATIAESDIVILGVSRTSKTPLSIYLASHGWKVANIPLVPPLAPPEGLNRVDAKVVCLTIKPERLATVREIRARQLGLEEPIDYAKISSVTRELQAALDFYRRHPSWPVIDVTYKSIEEIAQEVVSALHMEGKVPF